MTAMRRAAEVYLHDAEQVRGYIEDALAVFNYVAVPDEFREIAFRKAVELFAEKQVAVEQVAPSGVLLNHRPQG